MPETTPTKIPKKTHRVILFEKNFWHQQILINFVILPAIFGFVKYDDVLKSL
jgi:hypothetical protein